MFDPNYKMTPAETIRFLRSLRDVALCDGDEEEAAFWQAEAEKLAARHGRSHVDYVVA
jgi:hypothetical protein